MDSIDEYLEYQYGIMDHIQKAGASMSTITASAR